MEIYLTSDTHFSHDKKFIYEPRGFNNIRDMNMAIVERWNKTVPLNAIVYHLGDMALGDIDDAIQYIKYLNGKIIWLLGNHCTENKINKILSQCPNISVPNEKYALIEKFGKKSFYLSHYPTITFNFDDKYFSRHVFSLHGHTHQQTNWMDPKNPFLYHVGMDSHNCTPVHIDEVITDIRRRWEEMQ